MYSSGMSESNATPTRKPSGAAVAGAHPRPKKYPRQLVIMADDALADYIEFVADVGTKSKSEVARAYLLAGIKALDGRQL